MQLSSRQTWLLSMSLAAITSLHIGAASAADAEPVSTTISYEITAENLSDQPVNVELADRVAVSQIDDIEVDDVEIPKGASQNADGVVTWTATIGPKQAAYWRISYTLDYPNDLLARPRQEIQRKSMSPSAAPDAPSLYDQIEQLEKSL